jgi:prepilin-type N-terminal cleavage/methylation domain-containing protein
MANSCPARSRMNDHLAKRRRGFTLTEIAIVLGIVGLILGAIWTAASHVYANNRVTTAVRQIVTIANGMSAAFPHGHFQGGWQALSPYAVNAGIIPSDMLVPTCPAGEWENWQGASSCALTPFQAELIMGTETAWGGAPISTTAYEIMIGPLTASQCAAFMPPLVQEAAGPAGSNQGLIWAYSDANGGMAVSAYSGGSRPPIPE